MQWSLLFYDQRRSYIFDWKCAIINFVTTVYHKIIINFFENVALSKFSFINIKKFYFVDLPCLYHFLLFISCLLIYMLNYLLFLSMVHEYAYFFMNIFGNRSIAAHVIFTNSLLASWLVHELSSLQSMQSRVDQFATRLTTNWFVGELSGNHCLGMNLCLFIVWRS